MEFIDAIFLINYKAMQKDFTLETYENASKELSIKFDKAGVRKENIDYLFSFLGKPSEVSVLEIGCGNGRDAEYILSLTDRYLGIDYSPAMLYMAKERLPEKYFRVEDIEEFIANNKFDMIIAFASLLHLPKQRLQKVLNKIGDLLNDGGVFHLSLKYKPEYSEMIVAEDIGDRFFAYYNPETIKEILPEGFAIINETIKEINKQSWMDMVFRRLP